MIEHGSFLERLHAKRAKTLSTRKGLELPVPGWSGMVWIRYEPVDWEPLAELLERGAGETATEGLAANLEALGEACGAVLVSEKGTLSSLADELRSQGEEVHGEVRFDAVAVDALKLEVKDQVTGLPRSPDTRDETVRAVFAGAVSPELAITEHAAKLAAWMTGRHVEADAETLGN